MRRWVLPLLIYVSISATAGAITGGRALSQADKRLDAVGALAVVWRLGLDPTHYGAEDHSWFCSATLIDEQTVMTASHCLTPYGADAPYAIRFRRRPDGSVGSIELGVDSYFHARVASWARSVMQDVAFGTLEAPVTHIDPIPLVRTVPAVGRALTLVGWGKQGPTLGAGAATEPRSCANRVVQLYTYGEFVAIGYGGPYGSPTNIYANACGANNSDSGGPILIGGRTPYVVGLIVSQNSGPRVAFQLLPSDGRQAQDGQAQNLVGKGRRDNVAGRVEGR